MLPKQQFGGLFCLRGARRPWRLWEPVRILDDWFGINGWNHLIRNILKKILYFMIPYQNIESAVVFKAGIFVRIFIAGKILWIGPAFSQRGQTPSKGGSGHSGLRIRASLPRRGPTWAKLGFLLPSSTKSIKSVASFNYKSANHQ